MGKLKVKYCYFFNKFSYAGSLFLIAVVAISLISSNVLAENIYNYTPPPMFGEQNKKIITPVVKYFPKPIKKPDILVKGNNTNYPKPIKRPNSNNLLSSEKRTMPAVAPVKVIKESLADNTIKFSNIKQNDKKQITKENDKIQPDLTIIYEAGKTELSKEAQKLITEIILLPMFSDNNIRLQILSYATAGDNGQSSDHRYSLSRALNIKNWLQSRGIEYSRINIRALGDNTSSPNKDRVDFIFIKP